MSTYRDASFEKNADFEYMYLQFDALMLNSEDSFAQNLYSNLHKLVNQISVKVKSQLFQVQTYSENYLKLGEIYMQKNEFSKFSVS